MAWVNPNKVSMIAAIVRDLPEASALNFHSYEGEGVTHVMYDRYPQLGDPATVDYFFFQCLHQFGFWLDEGGAYAGPLYGTVDGKRSKGSELLERILMKRLGENPRAFEPKELNLWPGDEWSQFFSDDDGPVPFPDMELRRQMTARYADWMIDNNARPRQFVDFANCTDTPIESFLREVQTIPGFDGDPLGKKARLLALSLANRPERFLLATDAATAEKPIIDYHLMRLALRMGIVELSPEERPLNMLRRLVSADMEESIRTATDDAMTEVVRRSGRSLAVVDGAFWTGRTYCPEMEPPKCEKCVFYDGCAQRTELFQPVRRTTNY